METPLIGELNMKLYFAPGACSMATHIALRETGQTFDLEKVNLATKETESGEDYTKINPKGYVPALKLDSGEVLTEAAVTLQYVADQKPESGMVPQAGSMERYRLMESLNFISTEIHKSFGALFNPNITPAHKELQLALIGKRCDVLSQQLEGKQYLTGGTFSVADAYLFTVLGWSKMLNVDITKWPTLRDYIDRIAERPAVMEAMKAEGLAS
jgi:glutathione S-transferase